MMEYKKAEKTYIKFMNEVEKLYKELENLDNHIRVPFKVFWYLFDMDTASWEKQMRFGSWKTKVTLGFYEVVHSRGLNWSETHDGWVVLPFDLSVIPYTYDNDFSTLVDILTEYSHGNMFNNGTNVPHFHDYCEYGNMKHEDMIKVFQQGLSNIGKVRNSKLELVEDLCDELREQFSSSKLLKECENYVFK